MPTIPQIKNDDVEFHLLDDIEFRAILNSTNIFLKKVWGEEGGKRIELSLKTIWPGLGSATPKIHLVLLPLDRVGSEAGFSGTRVLITYFKDVKKRKKVDIHPSRPMVVKIRQVDKTSGHCKLKDEHDRALQIKKYAEHNMGTFAWPLRFDIASESIKCSILWSSFFSISQPINLTEPSRLSLTQLGLYGVLAKEMGSGIIKNTDEYGTAIDPMTIDVVSVFRQVFGCLKHLHWHLKTGPIVTNKDRYLVRHYTKSESEYLRGFRSKGGWGDAWRNIWGTEREKKNRENNSLYNPVFVLKQLEKLKTKMCVGAIHGDLHPRNIVFAKNRSPKIIDFGWANRRSHIAIDFVLLECNLRFMVLRPDISLHSLESLTKWIPFYNEFVPTGDDYIDKRANLIKTLHDIASCHFKQNVNWDIEYLVPFFIMAIGLLKPKAFSSCHNRLAAKITIEHLADYLGRKIDAGNL
jgi:hypothetical protein